jgi:predicted transcriptional regulator
MLTTVMRTTIALNKDDKRKLEELMEFMGDNKSGVIKSAIDFFHHVRIVNKKESECK